MQIQTKQFRILIVIAFAVLASILFFVAFLALYMRQAKVVPQPVANLPVSFPVSSPVTGNYTFSLSGVCINGGGVATIDSKYYPDFNIPCSVVATDVNTHQQYAVMTTTQPKSEWWNDTDFVLPAYAKIFLSKQTATTQRVVMSQGEGGGATFKAWSIDLHSLEVKSVAVKSAAGVALTDLMDNAVSNDAYYAYVQRYRAGSDCEVFFPTTGKNISTDAASCIMTLQRKDTPECTGIETGTTFPEACFTNWSEVFAPV